MRLIAQAAALAPLLLLPAAAADVPVRPGLWETRNTPGIATLNGQALKDLPLGEIKTETVCVGAAAAADRVRFFARDLPQGCTVAGGRASGGIVKVQGSCPNQLEGPDGTFSLTGKYSTDRYDVAFATTAVGDNGTMTFSGRMVGRRIGTCGKDRK
jgi:hypothetical protein